MENVSSFGPFRGLSTSNFEKADVVIKGIPFDGGASQGKGTCEAPDKVRELSANLVPATETGILMKDFHVYDGGDFPLNIHIDQYFDTIHQESKTVFETGKFPLFIGGDHSVTIPLQQAFLDTYGAEKKWALFILTPIPILSTNTWDQNYPMPAPIAVLLNTNT